MSRAFILFTTSLLFLAATGCKDDVEATPEGCEPRERVSCTCPDGRSSTRLCSASRLFLECSCPEPRVETACSDFRDNDGDGLNDCDDPDCSMTPACMPASDCESNGPAGGCPDIGCAPGDEDCMTAACEAGPCMLSDCADGEDNDGDGRTDCDDGACSLSEFCTASDDEACDADSSTCQGLPCGGAEACPETDNGCTATNDETNCDDPECADDPVCLPETKCDDGEDNDADGAIDCEDPDCGNNPICLPEQLCDNRTDDDFDGDTDCDDSDCSEADTCRPESNCDDGIDNDGDGDKDCADDDCIEAANCLPERDCADGLDNDGDEVSDCDDPDCVTEPACLPESLCSDGLDNDLDDAIDCADPDCESTEACACRPDANEPNDSKATAADSLGGRFSLHEGETEDWFAIEIPAQVTGRVRVQFEAMDGNVDLFMSNGDGSLSRRSNTLQSVESLQWPNDSDDPQIVYALVYREMPDEPICQHYQFTVTALDPFEPNQTIDEATPFVAFQENQSDGMASPLVISDGDTDIFRSVVCAGGSLSVEAVLTRQDAPLEINLVGPEGDVLVQAEGEMPTARWVNTSDSVREIYVEIRASLAGSLSVYSLILSLVPESCTE